MGGNVDHRLHKREALNEVILQKINSSLCLIYIFLSQNLQRKSQMKRTSRKVFLEMYFQNPTGILKEEKKETYL